MDQIRVLLAEDHKIVRDGIRSLLETEPGIKVVDEAVNGREVVDKLSEGVKVDVILADMNMPEMNGIETINFIGKHYPENKVLVLSMLDNENYVMSAFNAGAKGYLLKNVSRDELVFAIRHIGSGGKYLCNEIAMTLLEKQAATTTNQNNAMNVQLSKRETEVLILMAEGLTNNEIANKLFTSRRTIEGHRKNLIEKTGARNTAALIKFAIQSGILK
jgi:DNA-binding NarL/FixJ family response regulator